MRTHHRVGGASRDGRGGVVAAGLYEWGGNDPDGQDVFAQKRPGIKNGEVACVYTVPAPVPRDENR